MVGRLNGMLVCSTAVSEGGDDSLPATEVQRGRAGRDPRVKLSPPRQDRTSRSPQDRVLAPFQGRCERVLVNQSPLTSLLSLRSLRGSPFL